MTDNHPPSLATYARIIIVASMAGIISHLLRSSLGVLGPDLMQELSFSAEWLGIMTGLFFLVFALNQIPLGILLDRYGPRRVVSTFLLFTIVGCGLFVVANSVWMLIAGRVMMGLGSSALIISSFVLLARWFTPEKYANATSILIALGNAGGLLATAPLAALAAWLSWRGAFAVVAVFCAIVAALVFFFIQDNPPGKKVKPVPKQSLSEQLKGTWVIIKNPATKHLIAIAAVAYPSVATILALWGGPFLFDVYGLDTLARGNVLLCMAIAAIVSPLFYGWLNNIIGTRAIAFLGSSITVAVLLTLAFAPKMDLFFITVLMTLLGGGAGYNMLVLPVSRFFFPEHMTGRAVTTVNIAIVGGVAIMQMLTGFIVGAFPEVNGSTPEIAYRTVFATLAIFLTLGTWYFARLGPLPNSYIDPDNDQQNNKS
ncbi:MAG TPA: hypothetical protein DCZ12_09930 [Gammaproteobacteria bacterium]|nr:hypothetical protein [Gammaproteobacteria bacterium]